MTQETRAERRSAIREAAVKVFAEKGYHQARISDVARRAGVADGTIYLYYRGKEELLLSIFEHTMRLLRDGLLREIEGIDGPADRIRAFASFHFRQLREHRETAQVLQVELRRSKRFMADYRPEALWAYLGVFADIVRDGQEKGLLRPGVDPFLLMWAFFGALEELGTQWVLSRSSRFDLDRAASQVAELFLRGMAADAPDTPTKEAT